MSSCCVICGEDFNRDDDDVVTVKEKGKNTLKKFSELRKDGLLFYFQNEDQIELHVNCRKKYTKENRKGVYLPLPRQQVIPVLPTEHIYLPIDNTSKFDFKNECVLCENYVTDQNKVKLKKREIICTIGSYQTKETLVGALTKEPAEGNKAIVTTEDTINTQGDPPCSTTSQSQEKSIPQLQNVKKRPRTVPQEITDARKQMDEALQPSKGDNDEYELFGKLIAKSSQPFNRTYHDSPYRSSSSTSSPQPLYTQAYQSPPSTSSSRPPNSETHQYQSQSSSQQNQPQIFLQKKAAQIMISESGHISIIEDQ